MQLAFVDGAINLFKTSPVFGIATARKKSADRHSRRNGCEAQALPGDQFTGYQKMNGTNKPSPALRGRRSANLVDSQLEHLESMVQYVTRGDAVSVLVTLDHEYWEKRVRTLEETHELIASQRKRVIKLLDQLGSEAQMKLRRRTAA
ncbi:hypothetical protein [Paraburkholderia sp.]|uniref:hypothetical protein n=1 Tax=Paraburkholderia sp. TaxID=1926495 RepID=UPI002D6568A1|nr:hypothetical protein [Paraburkholderia sp.]HZZ02365.1 hypothetical protein [Paraburkholderia sp.]